MTRKEWMQVHNPEEVSTNWVGGVFGCPYCYPDLVKIDPSVNSLINGICSDGVTGCKRCWNTEIICDCYNDNGTCWGTREVDACNCQGDRTKCDFYPEKQADEPPHILDSGDRTEFETGAVRDMRVGKGRCDLMPMHVMGAMFTDEFFYYIDNFQKDGDTVHLYKAIEFFSRKNWLLERECTTQTLQNIAYGEMCLDVAKHFEDGAVKYGDNNWRKGIPVHCYIDSAVRHYLKCLANWKDEPHDRAVIWNLMCAIWTCDNNPKLNDYAKKESSNASEESR